VGPCLEREDIEREREREREREDLGGSWGGDLPVVLV